MIRAIARNAAAAAGFGQKRATPGGYGGKPPGVAFIGVPTGARNAGSGTLTGDQGTDMNGTRTAPPMCQDLISTESQEFTAVTRLTPYGAVPHT